MGLSHPAASKPRILASILASDMVPRPNGPALGGGVRLPKKGADHKSPMRATARVAAEVSGYDWNNVVIVRGRTASSRRNRSVSSARTWITLEMAREGRAANPH